MEEILKVGIAVKPQGVRGEIKVEPLTDDTKRFKKLNSVLIDGKPFKILSVRTLPNEVYITLSGVEDRNTAELFRGKFLCVKREDAVALQENSYFITDLMGIKVVDNEGNVYGKVFDITSAKTDVIWIKNEQEKIIAFPFLKRVLIKVDLKCGEMQVDKEKFMEVACYED